jgi:hypothetical protein
MPRPIYGGFQCRVSLQALVDVARGLRWVHECRDYDGRPVVVIVSLHKKLDALVVEAYGAQEGGRDVRNAAIDWERRLGEVMALPPKVK